jgi:hypothetical protein
MSISTLQGINDTPYITPDVDLTKMSHAEQMTFFMEQMR